MKIERRWDFIQINKDKQLHINQLDSSTKQKLEDNGMSVADLHKADLNGDGVITNAGEVKKLFGLINAHDTDGQDWTIQAKNASGGSTRAGRLHSVLSLQFADDSTMHLPPERVVSRNDFLSEFYGQSLDLSALEGQDIKNQLWGAGEASAWGIGRADLDGDGSIATRDEFSALFDYISKFDGVNGGNSVVKQDDNGNPTNAGKLLSVLKPLMSGAPVVDDPIFTPGGNTPADKLAAHLNGLAGGGINAAEIDASTLRDIVGNQMLPASDVQQLFQQFEGKCNNGAAKTELLDALMGMTFVRPGSADSRALAALRLGIVDDDGRVEGSELQQAERAMMDAGLTRDQAVEALTTNFGAHLFDAMDITAASYIRSGWGSMDGHVANFEDLLTERLGKGGMLMDTNFDGKLDGRDKLAIRQDDGSIKMQAVGNKLAKQVKIGNAIRNACIEMDKAQHDFALFKDHRANPDFFEMVPHRKFSGNNSTFKLKPGVKPSDAMNDIFNNPDAYGFECATAMVVAYYRGLQELLGDDDFDRIMGDLRIGAWDMEDDLRSIQNFYEGDEAKTLFTGDYSYIRNWDVSDKGRADGWQGENVIYLGDDKYYGHPFGVATADEIITYLNKHRNEGSTQSASRMEDLRSDLHPSVFQHDWN